MVEDVLVGTPGVEEGVVEEGQVLEPTALVDRLGQSGHDPVVPPDPRRVKFHHGDDTNFQVPVPEDVARTDGC
jgi:hypothetical protein